MITQDELKKLLHYNPETGEFTWLVPTSNVKVGALAGSRHKKGYWKVKIRGKNYQAHRLAWFYMTGEWPKDQIDHVNGIRDDNSWDNLREATSKQNSFNRVSLRGSSSSYKGVGWYKKYKKWACKINANNKQIHIGYFDCEIEAAKAYNEAAKKYFGEFAYLNPV